MLYAKHVNKCLNVLMHVLMFSWRPSKNKCACAHVCMNVYICVRIYTRMYVCMYVSHGQLEDETLHLHYEISSCEEPPAHVCMYLCMYVCMHVCETPPSLCNLFMRETPWTRMYVCMYVCMYVKLRLHYEISSCEEPPGHVCMYVCMYACM